MALHRDFLVRSVVPDEALHRDSLVHSVVLDEVLHRDSQVRSAVPDEALHRDSLVRSVVHLEHPDERLRHGSLGHSAAQVGSVDHSADPDGPQPDSDHLALRVAKVEPERVGRREPFSPEAAQADLLPDRHLDD